MPDSKKAVGLVVTLVVGGLIASFLFPVVIGQFSGDESATYTQSTGETVELQPDLNATLDSVDDTAGTASYTINASGETATATVDEGTNSTVTVDGIDVTIAPTTVNTGNATTTYDYPGTYGWGGGASALWTIIPVLLVLALFLFFVYMATDQL